VSFDRLLARLFRDDAAPWVLNGGYALELRFKDSRSTVGIDLTLQRVVAPSADGNTNQIVGKMLQSAADTPLGDWFEYVIGMPIMDLTAAPYGGARAIPSKLEWTAGHLSDSTWTQASATWSCSSRVKNLVDLALLIGSGGMDRQRVLEALRLTFERRGTHDLPAVLASPPKDWQIRFQALAEECGLPADIGAVFAGVQVYRRNAQRSAINLTGQAEDMPHP